MFASCAENGILHDSSKPSNDNTNVVIALREPFVVNQDPVKNSSQSPPQINHHCCYGCGDPLEGIFCHQCTNYKVSLRRVVPKNYDPKGERFLIALRFPTPPLACAFFIPRATVKQVDYWFKFSYPPSDTPVCYLCTCEQCGNILNYGTCLNCNSGTGNSFTYDPIPESFDEVQIIHDPPPQFHFNVYLCQICESNSHYGYECSQRVSLVYEPEPCYIQNFSDSDYSHDLPGVNPLIDHHCCYECRNSLNDFFCYQCTCEFCGNRAHVGYNCPAQVPPFQTLPS
nr:hypothetical protein [Tanacetum cinerariifolium]